jgi:hypothetical protein
VGVVALSEPKRRYSMRSSDRRFALEMWPVWVSNTRPSQRIIGQKKPTTRSSLSGSPSQRRVLVCQEQNKLSPKHASAEASLDLIAIFPRSGFRQLGLERN